MSPAANRLAGSQRAATVAAILSSVFGAVLIVWGLSLQAVSMVGGGLVSVGRGVMAVLILLGISLSRRHVAAFPYGLYKVENIIAAALGLIIIVLAYELAKVSIAHLDGSYIFSSDPKGALPFFLAAAVLGIVLGLYKRRVSRAEGCPSLAADATFSFADAIALVIIGIALALDIAGLHRVDAIAGLIIACFLVVVGFQIFRNALRVLLDASVSRDVIETVRRIAEAEPGVSRVLTVDGRNSGSFIFLHLIVEPTTRDLRPADAVAHRLEERIKDALTDVDSVGIEFARPDGSTRVAVPLAGDGRTIAPHLGAATTVAIFEIDDQGVDSLPTLVADAAPDQTCAGVRLAVLLGQHSIDVLVLRDALTDSDAAETLRAYDIDVRIQPEVTDLQQARAALPQLTAGLTPTSAAEPAHPSKPSER